MFTIKSQVIDAVDFKGFDLKYPARTEFEGL